MFMHEDKKGMHVLMVQRRNWNFLDSYSAQNGFLSQILTNTHTLNINFIFQWTRTLTVYFLQYAEMA